MSKPVIRVENLGKKYTLRHQHKGRQYKALRDVLMDQMSRRSRSRDQEEFWALNEISFEIQPGDRVGIIGRNGAGKSTLLKVLSRITRQTTGKIQLRGRVASLLEVGTGFHPELTGRENIYLNGAILGMSKAEIQRKFDEIVAFAEVEKFLDTPVKRYSSGMYVRLAFAVAAHLEPEILIVDEVLAVGDAQFQKKCLGKMEDVSKREGRTVLFVSHNMGTVQQLTQTSIVLDQGRLVFQGRTTEAINYYLQTAIDRTTQIYEVEHASRKYLELPKSVEFLRLEIENYPNKIIPFNADIHIRITVRGNEAIDQFRFSMTIFRADGTPVGSFFGPEIHSIQQRQEATFRLELQDLKLVQGLYYAGLATGKGNPMTGHLDYDVILDVLHFEVMAPEGTDGTCATWTPSWGAIQFSSPKVTQVIES